VSYLSAISWREQVTFRWVSDCCLTPSELCFSHIKERTSYISMRWYPLCTRPTHLYKLDFPGAILLKQQSAGRLVSSLEVNIGIHDILWRIMLSPNVNTMESTGTCIVQRIFTIYIVSTCSEDTLIEISACDEIT
jgi:hypothetical protein